MKDKFKKIRNALIDMVDESGDVTLVSIVYDSSKKFGDVTGICFGSDKNMAYAIAIAISKSPELLQIVESAIRAKNSADIDEALRAAIQN